MTVTLTPEQEKLANYELTQRAHCDLEDVDDYLARYDVKAAQEK